MTLTPELRQRIETTLQSHRVVLFMKGSPAQPRCGFSAQAAGILDGQLPGYGHVDVLIGKDAPRLVFEPMRRFVQGEAVGVQSGGRTR
jgi:glutaredoxin-related protein